LPPLGREGNEPLPPIFDLQNVSFHYDNVPALNNLTIQIEAGQQVALLGANGSGKSTLLRMLDGLCFPAAGTIRFENQLLTQKLLQQDEFAFGFRRRVAFVFQNPDVQLFNPTVFDEVAFAPLQMGWTAEEVTERVNQSLTFMRITHLKNRPPYRLSGGEKKRVALASVLVLDPDVLLLDEPTATLDPRSQSQVIDLIQEWKNTSKTIITATHQLDIVEDIAQSVFIMEAGSVAASGPSAEILMNPDLLLKANLVHAHRHAHDGVVHSHPHLHRHSHKDEHQH
jgi:cobalt/nickel transport system ATP-binding protein